MSIKTRNEMFTTSALAASNCHCTFGKSTGPTTSVRVCKDSGVTRCYHSWIHGPKKSKIIMSVPTGSQVIKEVKANATQEDVDVAFQELHATQHEHWELEEN